MLKRLRSIFSDQFDKQRAKTKDLRQDKVQLVTFLVPLVPLISQSLSVCEIEGNKKTWIDSNKTVLAHLKSLKKQIVIYQLGVPIYS